MRIVLPPELEAIGKEVRPYYDFTQKDNLRADTPSDIREKAAYFKKESERLYREAERLNGLPV